MADVPARLRELLTPLAEDLGLEVFDLEYAGGVVRVTVDRPDGVDIDRIAAATRMFSRALDSEDPVVGRYTLEVSSPGLERALRTTAHLEWALGKEVTVKTDPSSGVPRRIRGTLTEVDEDAIAVVATELDGVPVTADPSAPPVRVARDHVSQARTVFSWGPGPKPGRSGGGGQADAKGPKGQKRVSAP